MYSVLDEGDSQKPLNMQYMFIGNISASHVMILKRDITTTTNSTNNTYIAPQGEIEQI